LGGRAYIEKHAAAIVGAGIHTSLGHLALKSYVVLHMIYEILAKLLNIFRRASGDLAREVRW
jgi:hypothetical protein